jgi:hypothetical protein
VSRSSLVSLSAVSKKTRTPSSEWPVMVGSEETPLSGPVVISVNVEPSRW